MIGVLGGTFDPVHHGHLRIALDALEALGLAQVRLIPLAHAVHRDQPETPGELRLAMLRAALAGRRDLVADDRELRRGGPSYMVDTLNSLRAEFPRDSLCLLVGGDAFDGFADWRDPQGILAIANLAVLQRPGYREPDDPRVRELLARHRTETLQPAATGQITCVPVTQLDIAASDIRRRIAAGRSADFLTPPAVLELVARHGLYRRSQP
ncbi:MAG: nicotinate-nucleotide adenylyltransferase [Chromatiaceae bacterium]|jgi:nicotinate-nucleotide adenylyltransferase|nr:nicotinate-nucleotide adenylyltransferase [Chromatiaceae bacterium]